MAKKTYDLQAKGLMNSFEQGNEGALPPESPTNQTRQRRAFEDVAVGMKYFTPENAPTDYTELKEEVKFLANVNSQSFMILAHRLKIIRDKELYKMDGYVDFKAFVEGELSIQRATVYKYINVFEYFGVYTYRQIEEKMSNFFTLIPYVKKHPEDKEELMVLAENLSNRDLSKKLKEKYQANSEEERILNTEEDWFSDEQDLLAQSKFLREGMKPKTLDRMLKEIINLRMLQDPRNKELQKIKQILSKL